MQMPYVSGGKTLRDAAKLTTDAALPENENEPFTATAWKYEPVANLSVFEALPPAAKERETKKAADTFASTGRNVFVHYVTPILEQRRKLLLASGTTKKKYPKTAAQLWQSLEAGESFYWNEVARELRSCVEKDVLSPKGCLIHGGRLCEKSNYVWHAEVAVASYRNLPPPEQTPAAEISSLCPESDVSRKITDFKLNANATTLTSTLGQCKISAQDLGKDVDEFAAIEALEPTAVLRGDEKAITDVELLDTLPDRLEYEQNMLYSHFARYDYNEVRNAEGKHQTAMLRQLANLFDKTGKVLFYYYVVPKLCKQCHPPSTGETVTSNAADLWRFLPGSAKGRWLNESAKVKKLLGHGDIVGLETLQLDSLDGEVLKLHELAQAAIQGHDG